MIVKARKMHKTKIVEYVDGSGPHKVILPIESNDTALGIPYGMQWESVVFPHVTPERVARALRERGIWTANDLRGNVSSARAALMAFSNEILVALLQSIREVDR